MNRLTPAAIRLMSRDVGNSGQFRVVHVPFGRSRVMAVAPNSSISARERCRDRTFCGVNNRFTPQRTLKVDKRRAVSLTWSETPSPRAASNNSLRSAERCTVPAYLARAWRIFSEFNTPFVVTLGTMPWWRMAASNCGKSDRIVGSPPPRATSKMPHLASRSTIRRRISKAGSCSRCGWLSE